VYGSVDGSDLDPSDFWIPLADYNTFDQLINSTQAEYDEISAAGETTDKNQEYVDNLTSALVLAIGELAAMTKLPGTAPYPPDLSVLSNLLANDAVNCTADVHISSDGLDIASTDKWVTQETMDLFTDNVHSIQVQCDEIANAGDTTDKNQAFVNSLVTELTDLIAGFNQAVQYGTMP